MALTPSNMLPLGTQAPDFNLFDVNSDTQKELKDVTGKKGTVIIFMCNHCPYVVHVESEIQKISSEYQKKQIAFVGISSNDVDNYPTDSPDHMKEQIGRTGFDFPYLYDETQEVAKAYDAACTPDFYVFDNNQKLVYRGRLDESRPKTEVPLTGKDLRNSLDALLDQRPQAETQYPSMGCNIKWK